MKTDHQQRKYLSEYQPPEYTIMATVLEFELDEQRTRVKSRLQIARKGGTDSSVLKLDGVGLKLIALSIDGRILKPDQYEITSEQLILSDLPERFELGCEVEINPSANTRLEGLYLSSGNFCTQCEAEGFRHITYYLDRPDVMSVFTTHISGRRDALPVLLSNGNRVESGIAGDNHWVEWHDPHPKPSYLFALVAGDLACVEGEFTTDSGRQVSLQFFTEHHNREKCAHALSSLQKAMRWDEQTFGLEYDLDLYMVVAVDDFNMGAMENKGLNVFNTKYVLANPQTATDDDYLGIEGVIAHEYFHNWTGNRVTCRDWFQLSLKEGLTVFRDQEFSADMTSRAIQRINDVRALRNHQFAEDAGPMAHPIRPASYQEINNFYTATVYNKGAEVVRMIHTLLGADGFRKGMDLYFQRHDGEAVTTDDFRQAMQDASGVDLEQFQRWYEQASTPRITLKRVFDPGTQTLQLVIRQQPGFTRGDSNQPFHLPLRLALFDQQGQALALDAQGNLELNLDLRLAEQIVEFSNISEMPVVSALRGFSAPVILETDLLDSELALLMSCDSDPFNRWEAGQQLAARTMLKMLSSEPSRWADLMQGLIDCYAVILRDTRMDLSLMAEMLVLPSEKYLAEMLDKVDPQQLRRVREILMREMAGAHEALLFDHYQAHKVAGEYRVTPEDTGKRRLKNICLAYLLRLETPAYFELCLQQFETADNMTDQIACLLPVVHYANPVRDKIVARFYQQWQDTALVLDKWFSARASSYADGAMEDIVALFEHSAYSLHNPNRARSLLGALIANSSVFHQADGAGYQFVTDKIIELDAINPQIAARMANAFLHWRRLEQPLGQLMKQQIERMVDADLSNDLNELVTTSLAD